MMTMDSVITLGGCIDTVLHKAAAALNVREIHLPPKGPKRWRVGIRRSIALRKSLRIPFAFSCIIGCWNASKFRLSVPLVHCYSNLA
ncbi:hypothetical protein Bind_3453 [Beijerinckia indica subsp. indica ATCC 9039]|uniref:Uncharacterized protein n=1 Tax=Beijerinckia indica subsp. indica (strain ATCC 9039 / DSM 1715 / NCIMB 8712) TaxID=395963 RepID=B2IES0_BEII9|nr:hypothetical protein Bind_3453 [Beijerinckia indica subsp. indica ATCC 9039]